MFIETATSWGSAIPRRLQQLCSGSAGYAGEQVADLEQGWPRACSLASELAHCPQSLLTVLRVCSPSSHPGWTIISILKGGQK